MKRPAELPDQHQGVEAEKERQADIRRVGVIVFLAFMQCAPFVVMAIVGIWYAIAGSLIWLRWVLGVLGALSALRVLFWLPVLAIALYSCFLLFGKVRWWIFAVSLILVTILQVILLELSCPLWVAYPVLIAAALLFISGFELLLRRSDS